MPKSLRYLLLPFFIIALSLSGYLQGAQNTTVKTLDESLNMIDDDALESSMDQYFNCNGRDLSDCINVVCDYIPKILTKQRAKACFASKEAFKKALLKRYPKQDTVNDRVVSFHKDLCGQGDGVPLIDKNLKNYHHLGWLQKATLSALGLNQSYLLTFKKEMYQFCKKNQTEV